MNIEHIECKKITIAVFRSGKIIITGARSMEQINDAYNFVNGLLKKNFNDVVRILIADRLNELNTAQNDSPKDEEQIPKKRGRRSKTATHRSYKPKVATGDAPDNSYDYGDEEWEEAPRKPKQGKITRRFGK